MRISFDFMIRFLHLATYTPEQLHTRWVESSRRIEPEVEAAIEVTWQRALARPGVRIFDGPVCRFEALRAGDGHLTLDLSRTSYRIVVGTNFENPHFFEKYGAQVMSNPVGVSTVLVTSDGYAMMGRRNQTVAYYPHRVHPFAGSLEVQDAPVDLAANARRELWEELSLSDADLLSIHCLGIAEDVRLRHPETIYVARTCQTRAQIETQVHADEHHGAWHAPITPDAFAIAAYSAELTPIAQAAMLALGRAEFGEAWFATATQSIVI